MADGLTASTIYAPATGATINLHVEADPPMTSSTVSFLGVIVEGTELFNRMLSWEGNIIQYAKEDTRVIVYPNNKTTQRSSTFEIHAQTSVPSGSGLYPSVYDDMFSEIVTSAYTVVQYAAEINTPEIYSLEYTVKEN